MRDDQRRMSTYGGFANCATRFVRQTHSKFLAFRGRCGGDASAFQFSRSWLEFIRLLDLPDPSFPAL